jgi:hypothetical protein
MVVDAFEEDAFLLRRSRRMLGAAVTVVILGAALAWAAGLVTFGFWVAWVGLAAIAYGWSRSPGGAPLPVRVKADEHGLQIDGAVQWRGSRVAGGWIQPRPRASPVVHLRGPGGAPIRLVTRDVEQGRALLAALSVDASHVAADYWAMARPLGEPRAFAHAGALLGLAIGLGLLTGPTVSPVFAVALVALIVLCAGVTVPTRVVVGGDGVLLRWLGTVRYVPWSRVADVQPFDGGVTLVLAAPSSGGDRLTLRMPEEHERYHPERDAMVERMLAAFRAHGPAREEPLSRVLDRSGARTREWVRTMRALLRPAASFRTASIPPERLWRVVEDARADRTVRTGAAIALAPGLSERERARLKAVAAGCAEPRLRLALRTAAAEANVPDEALAEALDALESEGDDDGAELPAE